MFKKYVSDLKAEFKGYNGKKLTQDLMAGLTVAAVALPLALAFGVSSGADAASGLVTAIVAGIVIGILSGASYQISGPTGAMAAILLSVSAKYGITGVLTAGFISGAILIIAAVCRVGKLVSYLPAPVITGFTSGIAIIIALGQIDNFFGTHSVGENQIAKIGSYFSGTGNFNPNWWAVMFGGLVVLIMIVYPKKWNAVVPSSLVGIIVALIVNMVFFEQGTVAEVGAIPSSLVTDDSIIRKGFDFANITNLIMPAVSIAALGMIESLLCGASAGKMKGERLDASRELIAQGIGNMVIPLLGGVPATAAIARTSVAIKSGGQTRLVSVFHSVVLILSMFLLGGVMSRIPMAALAGVLMVTAFRMNDWAAIKSIFKKKFKSSILQYVLTMVSTVVFDLTVAIVIGVVAAMIVFVVKSSELRVTSSDIDEDKLKGKVRSGHHEEFKVVYVSGPLFFGTQEKLINQLEALCGNPQVILSMRGVPTADDISLSELERLYNTLREKGTQISFTGVQTAVSEMMDRAGFRERIGEEHFYWDAVAAIKALEVREYGSDYAD
ncbi:MAG: SulP family inorganic anion transporter [Oscillospiraceae bacterium]|jgi:SulP family sulfate permease|nr:sulphate transporter [Eubacterium sp. CAG:115]